MLVFFAGPHLLIFKAYLVPVPGTCICAPPGSSMYVCLAMYVYAEISYSTGKWEALFRHDSAGKSFWAKILKVDFAEKNHDCILNFF